MTQITMRQLEIFVQCVEFKSFHRCAEAIGVSQVAISEHIRSLETNLDYKLFERRPGSPANLTAEGEKAYQHALIIMAEIEAMNWDNVKNPKYAKRVQIKLSLHGYIYDIISNEIELFLSEHPNVSIDIQMQPVSLDDIRTGLDDNSLDLIYFFAIDTPGFFKSDFVSYEPLAIFVSSEHELALREQVSGDELNHYKAVRLSRQNYLRDTIDEAMLRSGIVAPESVVETEEYGLILSTVSRRTGFACMFARAVAQTSSGLTSLNVRPPLPDAQVRCAVGNKASHSPLVLQLRQRLSAVIQNRHKHA